ncbi:MAG TPA: hypothetical protein ENK25_02570 [Bacteroidetes bacterium]|nr:hypothetical protein [Bacteroidota bacterium]
MEVGIKLSVSLDQGLARVDKISWDACNESGDLKDQEETYTKGSMAIILSWCRQIKYIQRGKTGDG